jgi:hypothetical protein
MVSENPKDLYLIGTGRCLLWRKIVVAWKWSHRVSWLRMNGILLLYLNRLYIRQAISAGTPAHLFRTLVATWILSDKFYGRVFNVSWSLPSKSFQVHPTNLILLSTLNTNTNKVYNLLSIWHVSGVIVWVKIKKSGGKIVKIDGMTSNAWFFFSFLLSVLWKLFTLVTRGASAICCLGRLYSDS